MNPHSTGEKSETQRNLYPVQGHVVTKCHGQDQNLSLPGSKVHGFSAITQHKVTSEEDGHADAALV